MALIHWWPLNGDTNANGSNDYGLNQAKLANSNVSAVSGGKIGSCYSFNGSSSRASVTTAESIDYPISITGWIYPTNVSSTTTQYAFSYNTATGGTAGHAIGFGFYGSANFEVWAGGNCYSTGFAMANNTWYHVAVTIDENKKLKAYVNGVLKLNTTTGNHPGSTWFTLGARSNSSTGGAGGAAYYFQGKLNDCRIYDHCLTPKEVKEISKGLVVHYDFEDPSLSKNLVSGIGLNEQTLNTKANYRVVAESTTNFGLNVGDTYCWSVYVRVPTDQKKLKARVQFYNSGSDRTGPSGSTMVSNGEGLVYVSGTVLSGYNSMQLLIDFNSSVDITTTNIPCYYKMGKLEKGRTTPTAWTPNSDAITVYDTSGLRYNADQTINSVQLSSNTALGLNSAYFDGTTKILSPYVSQSLDELTYAAWVYPTARHSERSCIAIGGTYFTITGSGKLSGYAYGKSPAGYHTGTTDIPLNAWTHISIVWDKSYIYGYVNGVQDFKVACTGTFSNSSNQQIGIEGSSGRNYTGYIADFKIYATALSASDIQKEYQAMTSVDKKYNLFIRNIVEDINCDTFAKLNQQGNFNCKFINEQAFSTNFKTKDDGSLVANQFIEY